MKKKSTLIAIVLIIVLAFAAIIKMNQGPKNAIYGFDSKNVSADEYLDMMKETYGTAFTMQYLEKIYFSEMTVDEDVQAQINIQEKQIFSEETSEEDKNMLELTLRTYGYNGIEELNLYLKNSYLKNKILEERLFENFDNIDEFNEKSKPRILSHILIMSDEKEISEETQKQMAKIDAILDNSDDVKTDMIKLNDGEVIIAEQLGYVDKSVTNMDAKFLEAAFKLDNKELGDWVKTSFGYHRILVETNDTEDLKQQASYGQNILQLYPEVSAKILLDEMEANGMVLDKEFRNEIFEMVGVSDEEN